MSLLMLNILLLVVNSGMASYQINRNNWAWATLHLTCVFLNAVAIVATTCAR